MAVVVAKKDAAAFIKFADEENLEATQVAIVTEDRRLCMKWRNQAIVNLSRDFLDTNGVKQHVNVQIGQPDDKIAISINSRRL